MHPHSLGPQRKEIKGRNKTNFIFIIKYRIDGLKVCKSCFPPKGCKPIFHRKYNHVAILRKLRIVIILEKFSNICSGKGGKTVRKIRINRPKTEKRSLSVRGTPELIDAVKKAMREQYPEHSYADICAAIWASALGLAFMIQDNPVLKEGR